MRREGDAFANMRSCRADRTVEVGSFPAKNFDLHDTHGNAWEWADDSWNPSYAGAPVNGSVWSADASFLVIRGGSWHFYGPDSEGSAYRGRQPLDGKQTIPQPGLGSHPPYGFLEIFEG